MLEFLHGHVCFKHAVEGDKNGGRITAAAAKARSMRDFFFDMDINAEAQPGVFQKRRRRAVGKVRCIGWNTRIAACEVDGMVFTEIDVQLIRQTDRGHESFDLVESVIASPQHAEREVDFGWGVNCHALRTIRE